MKRGREVERIDRKKEEGGCREGRKMVVREEKLKTKKKIPRSEEEGKEKGGGKDARKE